MTNTPPTINVLLVEDNPDDVDLIKESLSDSTEAHFEVHNEGRLMRAQHQFAIREFDIVLLDLGLPDSSGLRTLETVLEWEVGLPIVVLTGLAEDIIGSQAVELGAHAYLVKRLESFNALPGNLIEAVEQHRAQQRRVCGWTDGVAPAALRRLGYRHRLQLPDPWPLLIPRPLSIARAVKRVPAVRLFTPSRASFPRQRESASSPGGSSLPLHGLRQSRPGRHPYL